MFESVLLNMIVNLPYFTILHYMMKGHKWHFILFFIINILLFYIYVLFI